MHTIEKDMCDYHGYIIIYKGQRYSYDYHKGGGWYGSQDSWSYKGAEEIIKSNNLDGATIYKKIAYAKHSPPEIVKCTEEANVQDI